MVLVCSIDHDVLTTLTKNEVDYLLELVHKEVIEKDFWSATESSVLQTLELIKKYMD